MITLSGSISGDRVSRRDFVRLGVLSAGGLTLPNVLRLQALAAPAARARSVIMIWLRGGASHIDSYDMKPDAPAEIRGEFRPIATNVPGIHLCEHMPRQATIMDRLSILRGIRSNDLGDHTPHYIITGFPDRGVRPALGSVVSYFRPAEGGMPRYVSMMYEPAHESETYTGVANRAFVAQREGLENLRPLRDIAAERLQDRRQLLTRLDSLRRDVDRGVLEGIDSFQGKAFEILASPKVYEAFDVDRESEATRRLYGEQNRHFLQARRLAEAGVSVVTLKTGDWDTHEKNFSEMRWQLPILDQGIFALVSDLYDRGLDKDVAVVVWGEFGRAPRISRGDGRDHWPEAGAAVVFGGGFRAGQVIGETDRQGAVSVNRQMTPSNVLATFYRHLGIDTAATIPDWNGRPRHVLDEREPVAELIA